MFRLTWKSALLTVLTLFLCVISISIYIAEEEPDFAEFGHALNQCTNIVNTLELRGDRVLLDQCETDISQILELGDRIGWANLWPDLPLNNSSTATPKQKHAALYFMRGVVHSLHKNHSEAVNDYSKAITLDPDERAFLIERARSLYHLERYNDAIIDIEKIKSKEPDYQCWYIECGLAFFMSDDYKRAIVELGHYVERNPDDADIFYIRGTAYQELGRYDEAVRDIEMYLSLNPTDSEAHQSLTELRSLIK